MHLEYLEKVEQYYSVCLCIPTKKSSPINAIGEIVGRLGPNYFMFTPEGIGMAVLVVCVTQAVDQIRIRREKWKAIDAIPQKERKAAAQKLEAGFNKMMAVIYIQNVLLFSVVLLVAAQAARTHGWF
jgi:hypothetical protein